MQILLAPLDQAVEVEKQKSQSFQEVFRESGNRRDAQHIVHETQVPEVDYVDQEVRGEGGLERSVDFLGPTHKSF